MADARSIWDYITKPSDHELKERDEVLGRAKAFLQWKEQPYYARYIAWLESEANKPIQTSANHMDMVVGSTRSNTFREVLANLKQLEQRAHLALGDD